MRPPFHFFFFADGWAVKTASKRPYKGDGRSRPPLNGEGMATVERPRILITNDDGIHADGIIALEEAVRELGDVYVVAPVSSRAAQRIV